MKTSHLYQRIDEVSRRRGIDPDVIISALEDAMLAATRKYYKSAEELQSQFNRDIGVVEVFAVKTVVDKVADPTREVALDRARKMDSRAVIGSEVRINKDTEVLGRLSAQVVKQVVLQKLREAKHNSAPADYDKRVGELVNCTVKRVQGSDVIVDLGSTEGRMPRREQSRLDTYAPGHRLRAVITLVERAASGPQVVVSRADAMLVERLLEMQVPEIYDGTVVIRAIVREAGERTKLAVSSKDPELDCVGACVGMKGMRVQSVIREIKGEKIDIIEYNEDVMGFAANALSPAKINRVSVLDAEEKRLEVIVDDTQLLLAVGKKGQNVRLAAQLLGWHIDIKSEEEKRREIETHMAEVETARHGVSITQVTGSGDKTIERLQENSIETVERLAGMTPEELTEVPAVGERTVERVRNPIAQFFEEGQSAETPQEEDAPAELVAPVQPAETGESAEDPLVGAGAVETPRVAETALRAVPIGEPEATEGNAVNQFDDQGMETANHLPRESQPQLAGIPPQSTDGSRKGSESDSRVRRAASMDELREAYHYIVGSGKRSVLPAHQNYQVRLKSFLRKKGILAHCEQDFVDVEFTAAGRTFIGEVKVTRYLTVIEAFRAALGQILDYANTTCSEADPGTIIFLDQRIDRQRTNLATKLGIAVVVEQGEEYELLNPEAATLLRDIFL